MDVRYSYLKSVNAEFIDEMFERYLANPDSVDESWRYFFEGIELGGENPQAPVESNGAAQTGAAESVQTLLDAYRRYGAFSADLNPLKSENKTHPEIDALEKKFAGTAKDTIAKYRALYCGKIGFEYTHIESKEMRDWLKNEIESGAWAQFTKPEKKRMLEKVTATESFEKFLHTRFVAKKRFSVEGGDAVIPMLDTMIDTGCAQGATDFVFGMAHRGRLNVLTNIFGKKYEYIFDEFYSKLSVPESAGSGDVKYHMGYSCEYKALSGATAHLSMASNPSHLEFVNPVVEGMARAKQRRAVSLSGKTEKESRSMIVPVLIHGDAAFAGQGVCYETVQLSRVDGYNTGGTIHVIINNQVGFTTDFREARSTPFASDMMKMMDAPIFHVNGDDVEAVCAVGRLATKFRQKFGIDVMIDIICYRKYGHNEGDEPSFTQPLMYKVIKDHKTPREIYAAKVTANGSLADAEVAAILDEANAKLQASYEISKAHTTDADHVVSVYKGAWKGFRSATAADFEAPSKTALDAATLKVLGEKVFVMPSTFTPHPKLVKLLNDRATQVSTGEKIEWGTGELLAYASLLNEGTHVRMSGQDIERGTFTHRHAVLTDFNTGAKYNAIGSINPKVGFSISNSILSETACMGFEFGYSSSDPTALVVWEAQFGDFANGAQVIIDQFLASSETKWQRMNGLTLLLPHGYEGQGPEHSSARLERFLQLCAENNMQVCNLSTPAQIFHALRRQVKREFRKPLVVMSPKKLLRLEDAVSSLKEFTDGGFQEVIDDPASPASARKLILCSGKVYYELTAYMREKGLRDLAVCRIEQFYPFPKKQVEALMKKYSSAKEVVWCQEEPRNQGAWTFIRDNIENISYVGRPASAAPASGSEEVHKKQQLAIFEGATK